MLVRESISAYKHLDLGNIKLAFTQVCREELFNDVYFAANSLYYVESGYAQINAGNKTIKIAKGEVCLIRQHSKLDILKFKDEEGHDFKSVIFYFFPDFVTDFMEKHKGYKPTPEVAPNVPFIHLKKQQSLKKFCESLLPLFESANPDRLEIREKTFTALNYLVQHSPGLLNFLAANCKPVKIDLYEFMIHTAVYNYSVSELARLTGRSLSAYKRDFYSVFETTPHQWLLRRRMDYAEQLLRVKKMKASDIYFILGFNELSHFSAAFKKAKGFPPSQI
jgi:AraC-like DNA-binding protein